MTNHPIARRQRSGAREYCFVIMSYKDTYTSCYEDLCRLIEDHTGLRCTRADREMEPGRDLLDKVHEQILRASVVVADVSEHSPNVYYEYGYSSAHDRPPILIARKHCRLPTDLVGKETLRYRGRPSEDTRFVEDFLACVDQQLSSPLPEQRRMLIGQSPFPAYLIAAPRVPGEGLRHWWHPNENRTFGDMLGISGILTAYGNLLGTRRLPELLHAQCTQFEVLKSAATFFCIGSSKVNPATAHFLELVQKDRTPCWRMLRSGPSDDPRMVLEGEPSLDEELAAPVLRGANGMVQDYGLIIRAPHPIDPRHLVLIAAGRHSIGTHAACAAITRQDLIADLERNLKEGGVSLRDAQQSWWAIVRGSFATSTGTVDEIDVVKAGAYSQLPPLRRPTRTTAG